MNSTAPASVKQTRESNEGMPVGPGMGDEELRKEAVASLKRKRRFVENVVGYVTVNGVLWLIWALTDRSSDGGMPWPAWVSAIWGFLLAMDAWKAFGPWPRSLRRPISDADIEREMKRFRGS
jgi:hypothetical protein